MATLSPRFFRAWLPVLVAIPLLSGCDPNGVLHEELDGASLPRVSNGTKQQIYDPDRLSAGGTRQDWYVNDHTIVKKGNTWHLFGITHLEPGNATQETSFAHATSATLTNPTWRRENDALVASAGETFIWAPHVIFNPIDSLYYMYYAAGPTRSDGTMRMQSATSSDLYNWDKIGTVFADGHNARDPFVTRVNDKWVMYYTATVDLRYDVDHIVAYRTSTDLRNWSTRSTALFDDHSGGDGAWTESPQMVEHDGAYYLFVSLRGEYSGTDVFRSDSPYNFRLDQAVGHLDLHAPEIVQDDKADQQRLTLTNIPMGDEPVSADWTLDFSTATFDSTLTWRVRGALKGDLREVAFNVDSVLRIVGDEENRDRPDGNVGGFPDWGVAGDGATSVVFAYQRGSAWSETNRWNNHSGHLVSWQSLFDPPDAQQVPWPANTYRGGAWRFGAINHGPYDPETTNLGNSLFNDLNR